ncbi:glycogen-binding domain-containing protein [bacterium]|nr:glycogen-binding domain-containing protein [bacterium]
MRRLLLTVTMMSLLVMMAALTGCAAGEFDPTKLPSPDKVGYHVNEEDSTVLFYFQPIFAENVTENGTDKRMDWDGSIGSVYIAGEFNGWDRHDWAMTKDPESGIFTLTKTYEEVGGVGEHLFKFVIDGEYWVEPPEFSTNKVDTGLANDSMNWILSVPPKM